MQRPISLSEAMDKEETKKALRSRVREIFSLVKIVGEMNDKKR